MGQVGRINTDQQEAAYDISCRMVLKQQKNQPDPFTAAGPARFQLGNLAHPVF